MDTHAPTEVLIYGRKLLLLSIKALFQSPLYVELISESVTK